MNEGYLPLYRKYRPQKLEDIVGQTHIKTALTNAINLNKISHAYLFTGPRGTGKTSTARILAKSLNCINGPTVTPCEKCESCISITNTVPIDVIEIDAASNRSVEDAHNILEKVQYAPVNGKYKIYIIDEVHMLTTQAFNALLKTLEEPPKNVIFILATTESHKVLDTIKSRCQRFDFKRITTNDIIEHLKKISNKENISITDGALATIAKSSAGGMRDSLALLDQVSTIGTSKEITEDDINNLLGRLSFDTLKELAEHITHSDSASAIQVLEKIYNDGNEPIQILTNLMMFFKNLLITKTCDFETSIEITGLTDAQIKSLDEMKNSLETHQILFLINKTAEYIKDLKTTTNQQMWLEVSLIDLANLADNTKLADLQRRLDNLESARPTTVQRVITTRPQQQERPVITHSEPKIEHQPVQHNVGPVQIQHTQPVQQHKPVEQDIQDSVEEITNAQPSGTSNLKALWTQILGAIPNQADRALLSLANPIKIENDGIVLAIKSPNLMEKANSPERKQSLISAANSILGTTNISILIRQPLPDDKKIEKVKVSAIKKPITPPKTLVEDEHEVSEQEVETAKEETEANKPQNRDETDFSRSDQSNMVKQLFDGKYLE